LAGLMMSLHMKATMMKISDPIIFGHCVKVYFKASHFIRLLCFSGGTKEA
jgi:monomeric isocitrate dehydrogenase